MQSTFALGVSFQGGAPCICGVLTVWGGIAGIGEGGSRWVGLLGTPPTEWGKKPSPMCVHFLGETDRPQYVVIVVMVVVGGGKGLHILLKG